METLKQKFQKDSKTTASAVVCSFVALLLIACTLYINYERQALYAAYEAELKSTAQNDSVGLRLSVETPIALMEAFSTGPLFAKDTLDPDDIALRMDGLIAESSLESMIFLTASQQLIHTAAFNIAVLDDTKKIISISEEKKIFFVPTESTNYVAIEIPCFKQGKYLGSLLGFCNGDTFSNLLVENYIYHEDASDFMLVNKDGYVIASEHTNHDIVVGSNLLEMQQAVPTAGDMTAQALEQALADRKSMHFTVASQTGGTTLMYMMPLSVADYETNGWSIIESVDESVLQAEMTSLYVFTGGMFVLLCALASAAAIYRDKMQREHRELATLIRNVPGGVHRCQLFGRVHVDYLSEGLCQLAGYTADEIQNDYNGQYTAMIAQEDRAMFEEAIAHMCEHEEHRILEYRMRRKDGHEFWVMDSITSIRDGDGKMRAYAVVMDFDDTKERYEQQVMQDTLLIEQGKATVSTEKETPSVFIRTFGYFDVFVNGEAISFKSAKAKELLAVLVDRKGGYVTSSELATYLYEDDASPKVLLARCRKAAMNLKNTLEEYGIGQLIETENNARKLNAEACICDYYQYLDGDKKRIESFHGEYMANYSWSEVTTAQLNGHSYTEY